MDEFFAKVVVVVIALLRTATIIYAGFFPRDAAKITLRDREGPLGKDRTTSKEEVTQSSNRVTPGSTDSTAGNRGWPPPWQ